MRVVMHQQRSPDPGPRRTQGGAGLVLGALVLLVGGAAAGFLLAGGATQPDGAALGVRGALESVANWLGNRVTGGQPALVLDIKFRHLKDLRDRRAAWAQSGVRPAGSNDATAATVRLGSRVVEVGVSLVGTQADGGPGELGRLRMQVRGPGDLFGMTRMVVDDPNRPGFQREALFYRALERSGLLAPRLQPIELLVNGKSWGVAVLVEQPSVEALVRHQRPDGVIVGWDPALNPGANADAVPWLDPRRLDPQVEGGSRKLDGTPLADQASLARALLRDLVQGRMAAENAVDVAKTARFVALAELWGLDQALAWHGPRWVLHPVTLRLEPFARLPSSEGGGLVDGLVIVQRLMASERFRGAYDAALREEATRLAGADDLRALRSAGSGRLPGSNRPDAEAEIETVLARGRQLLDASRVSLAPAPALGQVPHPLALELPPERAMPFARVDHDKRAITVPAGTWDVTSSVLVPDGYRLTLEAGTRLRLGAGVWLIVRGPCDLSGTVDNPVELAGLDVGGGTQRWGGILVMDGKGSKWTFVRVRDAAGTGIGLWQPTAAVVFVDGEVEIKQARFEHLGGAQAAMRVLGGSIKLRKADFASSAAGGLQLTQATAELAELRFDDVKGDALDVVGGKVSVRDMWVRDAGGAAVRAGMQCDLQAERVDAERVATGLVARDGARVKASAGRMSAVKHLGYLAYNHQPGLRPATLEAVGMLVQGARQNHLCTGGASVTLEGRAQNCSAVSVQQLVAAGIARN